MSRVPISQEIADHQKLQKAKIYNAFKQATNDAPGATVLSKAEFEEQFPTTRFEIYSLESINKFRQELQKADDVLDKDGAFKKATEDLTHLVVHGDGKKVIFFAREKQKGE